MKVKSNNLLFSSLPSSKMKKKLLKADNGMHNPGDPRIRSMMKTLPDDYFDIFDHQLPGIQPTADKTIDTNKALGPGIQYPNPNGPINNHIPPDANSLTNQPNTNRKKPNFGNAALLGLEAFDEIIPGEKNNNQYLIQPQEVYNQHPYGTGSQAIMQEGGEVQPIPGTKLTKEQQVKYNSWRAKLPKNLQYEGDYDLKGLWLSNPNIKPSSNLHFPDTYKLPNHPTFSNESKYFSNSNRYLAGHWQKTDSSDNYIPYDPHYKDTVIERHYSGGQLMSNNRTKPIVLPEGDQFPPVYSADYGTQVNPIQGMLNIIGKKDKFKHNVFNFGNFPPPEPNFDTEGIANFWRDNYTQSPGIMPQVKVNKQGILQNIQQGKDGHWIQKAINPSHKGYCTPMTKSTCTPRRKALAKTFKKHHGFHEYGGPVGGGLQYEDIMAEGGARIIPDNMSVFNPHMYANGGDIPKPPDTFDLLEQYIKYHEGGTLPDMLGKIVHHPNQMDMQGFNTGGSMRGGSDTLDLMEQLLPWDTGEYKRGGSLSPSKAREILHDGTAHGHKITDRQRRYFGAVASGYADMGATSGPGGNPFTPTNIINAKTNPGTEYADLVDRVNRVLVSGNAASGIPKEYTPDQRQLLQSAYIWKKQNAFAKPEDSIQGFYSRPVASGNTVDALRQKISNVGHGPTAMYYDTADSDLQMRQGKNLASNQLAVNTVKQSPPGFANGGVMYDDGGEIDTMWGGNVRQISDNPNDGGTLQFNGASHADGGIGMHYNGKPVEVEGGETAAKDSKGNLNIFGNMYLPGTKTKFKTVAKEMGEKERRYDMLKTKGANLVNNSNPANKFEKLAFNAGDVMMKGGVMGQKDVAGKKEKLANLQRAMLETADMHNIDAQEMSKGKVKKAKGGTSIPFAQDGDQTGPGDPNDPSRSDRNNNPGNIRYGKFAKEHGAIKADKDGFAIFPNKAIGSTAMKTLLTSKDYKDMDIHSAIKKWTGNLPYRYTLGPDLEGKKISDLNDTQLQSLMGIMAKGEGSRYGAPKRATPPPIQRTPFTPFHVPDVPLTPNQEKPIVPVTATPPPVDEINVPGHPAIPTNAEPLHLNEVLGEIYAAATNKQEPVAAQKFTPEQFVPYQVSFQDRLNQNQNTFNSLKRIINTSSPSALGSLAANKYSADSGVKAEEFRTNQGISDEITNKNIALENDAQLKNLSIADQQYVRQSTAKSKTKDLNQAILNSLSSKFAQNELEGKRLKAYENLYDYRFVPTELGGDKATYFGPNASFNYDGSQAMDRNPGYNRSAVRTDAYGNVKSVTNYKDDELKRQKDEIDYEMKRRNLPLLSAPELFWGGHLDM